MKVRGDEDCSNKKMKMAMDLAYMCQAPNAFICVSPNAFLCVSPNAFICVSPNAFICVSPNALYVCHQMRLYVCHQMRPLNPQRNSLRSLTFARFARTFFNSLN